MYCFINKVIKERIGAIDVNIGNLNLNFTSKSEPECNEFLKIKKDGTYFTIDEFFDKFHSDSDELLNDCFIEYRNTEKSHHQIIDDYTIFSESLKLYHFEQPMLVIDEPIRVAIYFTKKATDCLKFAHFFTMKSALLLDTNYNLPWSQAYAYQYLFRCINFGTASTWYSNCFDHILQIVYWGLTLYTSVVDEKKKKYDETFDIKKTMKLCRYKFVVGELKKRNLKDVSDSLTSCYDKMKEVRDWANYIKHKGGIDYKHLEAENPCKFYMTPIEESQSQEPFSQIANKFQRPDERFAIKDFKSPIEVDIDEKLYILKEVHSTIYKCLDEIVIAIDFNRYSLF